MLRVDLLWTRPDPGATEPMGRSFDDFFRDGGAWRMRAYEVPDAAITAARAEYRGPDGKGYGVAVRVWDGTHYTAMSLDPGRIASSCTAKLSTPIARAHEANTPDREDSSWARRYRRY